MSRTIRFRDGSRANDAPGATSHSKMASAAAAIPQGVASETAPSEDEHVSAARQAWLARLIDAEGPGIVRLLWRLLGCEADVLDAYQDCFCKLAARKDYRDLGSAKAYVYRMATNIAIEMIRSRARRRAHLPKVALERADRAGATDADVPIETGRLEEALVKLPVHLRNVVVLRDLSQLSYAEVGRTLGIEPTTARVYRRHAVVRLAELLAGESES